MKKKLDPWWSVLLSYPEHLCAEGPETYYAFVRAPNRGAAVFKAQLELLAKNEWGEIHGCEPDEFPPDMFEEQLVLKGRHKGV